MRILLIACLFAIEAAGAASSLVTAQTPAPTWTQWGGPTRDFMVAIDRPRERLARSRTQAAVDAARSAKATRRSWPRTAALYTHVSARSWSGRRSQEEVVAALDAATGKTIWEHRYPSSTTGRRFQRGRRPARHAVDRGQPAVRRRLAPRAHRARQDTGKVLWSHDLIKEYRAPTSIAAWPTARCSSTTRSSCRSAARGQALGAFNPETGALLWKAGDVEYSPASPMLIDVDGQTAGRAVRRRSLRPRSGQRR